MMLMCCLSGAADELYFKNDTLMNPWHSNNLFVIQRGMWLNGSMVDTPDSICYEKTDSDTDFSVGCEDVFNGSVYMTLDRCHDGILSFRLHNETADTLYMFDSYFHHKPPMMKGTGSEFLHRYDPATGRSRLSLLPMHIFMGSHFNSGEDRKHYTFRGAELYMRSYVYHFSAIPPRKSLMFQIPVSAFEQTNYVVDNYPERITDFNWHKIKFNRKDAYDYNKLKKKTDKYLQAILDRFCVAHENRDIDCVYLEIAFYDSVDWINIVSPDLPSELKGWKGMDYMTVTIPVLLKDVRR